MKKQFEDHVGLKRHKRETTECGTAKSFPSSSLQTGRREIFMFPEEQKLKSRKRTSKHDEGNETSPWLTAAGHVKWTRSCTERSLCPERQRNLCLHVPEIGTSEKSKIKMKLRIFYSRRPGAAERHFPSGLDVCLLSSFSLLSLRIYAYADIFISYFRASPHNWRKKNTTKRSS